MRHGNFSIEILLETYQELKRNGAKYLCCKDFSETAKLETMEYCSSGDGTSVILTGRFLESVLGDRVVKITRTYTGTTEEIARNMVNEFCIGGTNPVFDGKLKLGSYKGLGHRRTYQNTGDDIKTALYELLKLDGLSYSVNYDYEEDGLTFEVWSGVDRTENQEVYSWATFCKNFENILEDKYSMDETQFKNFAYVAGEGRANNRVVVEVNGMKTGEERKELYVDARDLQQDEKMSDAEYREALRQRGLEKLQENKRVEMTEFAIDPEANLEYHRDYELGDVVMYKNEELGLYVENRIVEIAEVYDGEDERIEVVFGDDYQIRKVVS